MEIGERNREISKLFVFSGRPSTLSLFTVHFENGAWHFFWEVKYPLQGWSGNFVRFSLDSDVKFILCLIFTCFWGEVELITECVPESVSLCGIIAHKYPSLLRFVAKKKNTIKLLVSDCQNLWCKGWSFFWEKSWARIHHSNQLIH